MKPEISILTVSYNSAEFIKNLLYCLSKLTSHPNYSIYILDNGSLQTDFKKLKAVTRLYMNISLERHLTNSTGSFAHAEGLNYLIKKVKTPYFAIIDPDACPLIKNWDRILIDLLGKEIKAVGTQASSSHKPGDFPLVFLALFETKIFQEQKINFSPGDLSKYQDVGYEIREKYLKAGYRGKLLEAKNTRHFKKGPFRNLVGISEYYLDGNYDNIIASHFGRGSILGATKYKQGVSQLIYSLPKIGPVLVKKKGEWEKEKWIKICHEIIKRQVQ